MRGGCCIPPLTLPLMFAGLEFMCRAMLEPTGPAAVKPIVDGWQTAPAERAAMLAELYRQVVERLSREPQSASQPAAEDTTPAPGQYL